MMAGGIQKKVRFMALYVCACLFFMTGLSNINASADLVSSSQTEEDITAPLIEFIPPTPKDGSSRVEDNVKIKVSSTDAGRGDSNISVLIDFNNSLVSWWRMDDWDGDTIIDHMGRNDGTSHGTVQVDGYMGSAMSFAGGYMEVEHDGSLNPAHEITYAAWIYSAEPQIAWTRAIEMAGSVFALVNHGSHDGFYVQMRIDGIIAMTPVARAVHGVWTHWAVTWKSGDPIRLYRDGRQVAFSDAYPGTMSKTDGSLQLGRKHGHATRFFKGMIDDVMIFNRALSEDEIKALCTTAPAVELAAEFTGLQVGGRHPFKAFAQDKDGNVGKTEERTVLIGGEWAEKEPVVITAGAHSITTVSGMLTGSVADDGGGTVFERGFEWGTESRTYTNRLTESGIFGQGAFGLGVENLDSLNKYFFRAKSRNSEGWGYGQEQTFQTKEKPTFITEDPSEVTPSSARLTGQVTDLGSYDEVVVYFQYKKVPETRVDISNPYEDVDFSSFGIYKSNLHTHTTQSDGRLDVSNAIMQYSNNGYDILAITDHDTYRFSPKDTTWPWTNWISERPSFINRDGGMETSAFFPALGLAGMLAVRGNELSAYHHTGSFFNDLGYSGLPDGYEDTYFSDIEARNGLGMFYHPGRYRRTLGWYNDLIDRYRNTIIGIEVYNAGDRYSGDRAIWDGVNRARDYTDLVWGSSNDDMHAASQLFRNYNLHYMSGLNEDALRDNMRAGAFTFSYEPGGSGKAIAPTLTNIVVNVPKIILEGDNYSGVIWYGNNNEEIHSGREITVDEHESNFVRAVIYNDFGRTYTQPFGYTLEKAYDWAYVTEGQTVAAPGIFSSLIRGLEPATEYKFRVVIEWNEERAFGETRTYSTLQE